MLTTRRLASLLEEPRCQYHSGSTCAQVSMIYQKDLATRDELNVAGQW